MPVVYSLLVFCVGVWLLWLLTAQLPVMNSVFKPYNLRSVARARAAQAEAILTGVNVEGFFYKAVAGESRRFEEDEDDLDGIDVALRPDSPLTELESDSETSLGDASQSPEYNKAAPGQAEKERKRKRNQKRRQKKRVRKAESSHKPDEYAAKPHVVKDVVKTAETVKVTGDAINLPTTSGGSWVGKRQPGIGDEPWKLEELHKLEFQYLKWDGS